MLALLRVIRDNMNTISILIECVTCLIFGNFPVVRQPIGSTAH